MRSSTTGRWICATGLWQALSWFFTDTIERSLLSTPNLSMQRRVNIPANDGSVQPYLYSASGCSMVATKSVPSQPETAAHSFAADDQHAVAHAGGDGHNAQLYGGCAGGGAVFHGFRHRGTDVERIHNRAGGAADAADHAGAH